MRNLNTQQIETLKVLAWSEIQGYYKAHVEKEFFKELTDYDIDGLIESSNVTLVTWQIDYIKGSIIPPFGEKYTLSYKVFINNILWAEGGFYMDDSDVLGLFTPKVEEPATDDIGKMTVENFFNDDNPEIVLQRLKDYAPELVDELKKNIMEELTMADLSEPLYDACVNDYLDEHKEEIAKDWIEDYPDDAWDEAFDHMSSSDVRDKIIDYLENNL